MRPGVTDFEHSNEIGISTEVNFRLPDNFLQTFSETNVIPLTCLDSNAVKSFQNHCSIVVERKRFTLLDIQE